MCDREGQYWLALLLDAAFPATAAMAHASDVFQEGWLIVKAKHPKGWRGYSLQPEERLLVVNSMLRLKDIKFESQPRRQLRPAPAGACVGGRGRGGGSEQQARQELSWLGADSHNLIMACVRDDM